MSRFRSSVLALSLALASSLAWAGSVDLNRADAAALSEALVGVGPHKAAAIVEYRHAHGPFNSVDDLAKIKGIGPSTVERNRSRATVTAPKRR